jgi:non-canonical poly(A) RNA polymerase PAPD5/7
MHAIRSRPVCRARNPFSPSAALWQHFVAPAPSLPQHAHAPGRRTAALQAVRDAAAVDVDPAPASFRRVSLGHGGQKSQPTLRRGKAGHPPAGLLLSEAQAAFRAEQDYVGVAVLPVSNAPARESQLPWVVRNRDIVKSGHDR